MNESEQIFKERYNRAKKEIEREKRMETLKEIGGNLLSVVSFILLIVTIITVTVFSIVPILNWQQNKACLSAYEEYHPQYSYWSGCRVEWNGKITPVDIIREIN